jgi:hypothetical protein
VVRRYRPERVVTVDGIRVVDSAQALVDSAPTISTERLRRALDDLVVGEQVELDTVRSRYLAAKHRSGLAGIADLLHSMGDAYVPTDCELEVVLRQVASAPALPPVDWQASLPWAPGGPQRVDGLIEAWHLILEGDGRRWHVRVADFERDHERDLTALRNGYLVARFTWTMLTARPDECVRALVNIGRARASLIA